MKKKVLVTMLSVLTLALVGCSSTPEVKTDKAEPAEESTAKKEKKEEKSQVGKRSNPVKLGETATFDTEYYDDDSKSLAANVTMSISNPIRGEEAYNHLVSANQFNEEAPEGKEWLIFDVKYKVNTGSEDDAMFVSPTFLAIASSGEEVSQESYATFATGEEFGGKDLYEGGETSGKVGILVNAGDETLIEYSDWSAKVFFSLK